MRLRKIRTSGKLIQEFFYKDLTVQQVIDQINKDLPITLKFNKTFIKKVCNRYPFLEQEQIEQIIQATFESIRELLLQGKIINIPELITNFKIHVNRSVKFNRLTTFIHMHLSTPIKLKKYKDEDD